MTNSNFSFFLLKKIENINFFHLFHKFNCRLKSTGGRSHGKIVSPRRKHFVRQVHRLVDLKRILYAGSPSFILQIFDKVKRTANLAMLCYPMGAYCNILAPMKIQKGDLIRNQTAYPKMVGDSSCLKNIPGGTMIHNISLHVKGIGQLIRSAGCSAILIRKESNHALIKLKSGEIRHFPTSVTATIGVVSNEGHFLKDLKKAGASRYRGRRSRTRPSSMNPVDHPMGGRTRGGCQPMNSKGIITSNRSTKRYYHPAIIITKRYLKFRRY